MATIEVPFALRDQVLVLELVWLYGDREARHHVFEVPVSVGTLTVEDPAATMLGAALYTEDAVLVDAWVFSNACPSYPTFEAPVEVFEVPDQYATIQEAIDAAVPPGSSGSRGSIVYVHPGVYSERVRLRPGVRLIGAGADRTILDGQGMGESLIDFSQATNAVVRGFTLRNVGVRELGCGSGDAGCAASDYAAAVFGQSSDPATGATACSASIVLAHNVIEGNDLGVVLGVRGQAIIRSNLFLSNANGVLAAYQGDHALIMGNTFHEHTTYSVAFSSGELDFVSNVVSNSGTGVYGNGTGGLSVGCNMFGQVGSHLRNVGDIEDDTWLWYVDYRWKENGDYRLFSTEGLQDLGCYSTRDFLYDAAPGAYGGLAGDWFQQEISVESLRAVFESRLEPAAGTGSSRSAERGSRGRLEAAFWSAPRP